MKDLIPAAVALLAGAFSIAVAQAADTRSSDQPELIVVTASRLEQTVDDLSQTVEVITQDEIERLWAASATEVLRQVPGTNVVQQGGRGGGSTILLRGGEANFTVVLIDGVQVNDTTNTSGGAYDIASLEQAQIEDVEIVFGTMSPIYGSDALSGVVNFVTRGADAGSSVSVEAGTQGYGSASAFYGAEVGAFDMGIGVYGTDDDGDVEGSDYKARGLHGKFGSDFAETGRANLSLGYQSTDTTSFPQDSGGPELAVIRAVDERDAEEYRAGLDVAYGFADIWTTNLLLNYYRRDDSYTSRGIAPGVIDGVPPNGADSVFSRKQILATVGADVTDKVAVLVGAEWQNEDGNSAGYIDFGFPVPTDYEIDRDTVSAFAEASAELGRFVLQGGLRYDDPDEIDSVTSVRVGLIYRLADDLTEIRANWGDGFKAPSFFVLANPIVGNPDLQPEKAESADLGIKHRFSSGSGAVEFVVFHNEYKDLIDFDDTLFTNVNRDKVITKGAEAAIDLSPLDTLDLRAQVTYLDTDIVDSNEPLRSRPRWRGGLIADWEFVQDWRWVTSVLSLDDFYESSVPTGEVLLGGYTRVDTSVSWQATEALSLGLAVDNLFDKDYQEAVGFPAAGIRGRLGARYKF